MIPAHLKFPTAPEALSAGWLTSALRQCGAIDKAAVVSFEASALAENQGFFGSLVRLRLVYDQEEAGAPRSLIAKFSSTNAAMRQRSIDSYEREVYFYGHLARQTQLPTPASYYQEIDPASGYHLILLEDLAPAASGSRVAGCSLDQAQMAIEQIANLHATWWEQPQPSALDWLIARERAPDPAAFAAQYAAWWPLFFAQAEKRLPQPIQAMGAQLGKHGATIRQHVFGSAPRTLIHRDYQLDNLIFATPAGGIPFAVVDWQFISRGRGVWDVAYFLSESLQTADRRAGEMEILQGYHRHLLERIQPQRNRPAYSFADCLRDYRFALLQRFIALVSTIAAMPFSEEQRHIHLDILLPRTIAIILDHDAGEVL